MSQLNYFTCTLGQAAAHGVDPAFTNINDFLVDTSTKYPEAPAVGFYTPSCEGTGEWNYRVLTFSDVLRHVGATAKAISTSLHVVGERERATVALLCPSTEDFLLTWLGLIRLGHPVLLIAPQCSPSGIADLCKQCNISHLFCHRVYQELAQSASKQSNATDYQLHLHALPTAQLVNKEKFDPQAANVQKHHVAYLHHTSGTSSGSPKPIPQTHHAAAGVYARLDGSHHATFTTTPLYHGGIADLFRAWTSHALIWLFPGRDAPITATNVVKCLDTAAKFRASPIRYFSSVPYVLEMLAADSRGLEHLQGMDVVGVGGAALPAEVGDHLVSRGVNLASRFGSAECGFLMSSHRDYVKDKAWQFLRTGEGSSCLRFEPRDDDLYELVILPGWPHMSKTNRSDGSFATSDLFKAHPSMSQAWKYDSRADSQLTLITGKKFDPAPLESAIVARSDMLQDVLVFGEGKPYPGALLFPSHQAKDVSTDELLAKIAAEVAKLNAAGQKHTHIPRSTLVPMPYVDVPLEKSSKGTILRKQADARYSEEIEAAYQDGPSGMESIPDADVEQFILDSIRSIMSSSSTSPLLARMDAQTDLFTFGIDSVACIQIRRTVSKLLPRESSALPLTIVQDTGSARKLGEAIIACRHGCVTELETAEDKTSVMQRLVKEYMHLDTTYTSSSGSLPPAPPRSPQLHGKTVLLTGSTGSLGSHLLCQLLACPEIRHVHLLVRGATQKAAEERVLKALLSKGLPLCAESDTRMSIHRYSLTQPCLGLSDHLYSQLVQEVESIYHLAWAVDFTLPVHGFKQHFAGLKALLELSVHHSQSTKPARKPAQLIFCSSTASVASYQKLHAQSVIPEAICSIPDCSGDIGYSRSKWVAENICNAAAIEHPELRNAISIIRVGQLSGDSVDGVWNKSEAYPLMLSSVKATGCLPDLPNESVGWVPVDLAAKSFLDLVIDSKAGRVKREQEHVQVLHLLSQDRTTTWRMLLAWLKRETSFDVVEASEWLARLEDLSKSETSGHSAHSSLKLLEFWKVAYGGTTVEGGTDGGGDGSTPDDQTVYEVKASLRAMPTLREVKPVDEEYARKLWKWIHEHV